MRGRERGEGRDLFVLKDIAVDFFTLTKGFGFLLISGDGADDAGEGGGPVDF